MSIKKVHRCADPMTYADNTTSLYMLPATIYPGDEDAKKLDVLIMEVDNLD